MSFLAPWFLALGAAVVVPLLIHLLRRRIGLQVDFPAARYLARARSGITAARCECGISC